jgi:RNA polymerase sigma-70 factor (ECF subfamily)
VSLLASEPHPQLFTTSRLGEDDLLRLARAGEGDAFREIMRRHNPRLYRVARGILRDEAEAEDVVQETFVHAFTGLASFRGEARLATWLTRIALNEAFGRLRRQRLDLGFATQAEDGADETALSATRESDDPERAAAKTQIRLLIERAIDELPEHFRLVFVMRDVEELSIEDTARLLELRPETVKTRLHRARRLLRSSLQSRLSTMLSDIFPFAGARCARIRDAVMARLANTSTSSRHIEEDIQTSS